MDFRIRIEEIGEFLRFATVDWPRVRGTAGHAVSLRCQRCIVSERAAPLIEGLCPECRAPAAEVADPGAGNPEEAAALADLLRSHQDRGRGRHDALVMFSGGKDSALLLHRLQTDHPGLRLLALTVDNGFMSHVALANAARIIGRLGAIDHMVYKPRPSLFETAFRHAFTHLNPGGCYTTVDQMDGDLVFDIGRNLAAEMDIPLLIGGLSGAQVERILGFKWFEGPREREGERRTTCAGFQLADLYTPDELRFWWDGTRWPEARRPRVLFPFHALPYDEQKIREEVLGLGLIEAGHDDPLVTNNDTIPVMLATDVGYMGYSGFEPEFASLVRKGKAPREIWLWIFEAAEHLGRRGELLPKCVDDTLGRLGLTRKDVGIPAA